MLSGLGTPIIPFLPADLEKMTELGISMLHDAITAFVTEDYKSAVRIPIEDDKVDALYDIVRQDTINTIMAKPFLRTSSPDDVCSGA